MIGPLSIIPRAALFSLLVFAPLARLRGYHRRYPENEAVSSYLEKRKPLFLLNAAASMRQEAEEKRCWRLSMQGALPPW